MIETYKLKHPIVRRLRAHGGEEREETITEITIRRLKAKDLRVVEKAAGKFSQSLALIGALTGLSPQVVDELDGEDVEGIGEVVGDFFPGRLPTGETSSEI